MTSPPVTYPGVYIHEVPSGVKTISSVATSIAAFVGFTASGIDNRATLIFNFGDYVRKFGNLDPRSEVSYAVRHFFDNGGGQAYVVRVPGPNDAAASVTLTDAVDGGEEALVFTALSRGAWANSVIIDIDHEVPRRPEGDADGGEDDAGEEGGEGGGEGGEGVEGEADEGAGDEEEGGDDMPVEDEFDDLAFNLTITNVATDTREYFPNVTLDGTRRNFVMSVVNDRVTGSRIVSVEVPDEYDGGRPAATGTISGKVVPGLLAEDVVLDFEVTADGVDFADIPVTLLEADETRPTTVLGLARLLERKVTAALREFDGGAKLDVTVLGGNRLRLAVQFSNTFDARLTFADGQATSPLQALGLDDEAAVNVAHARLGLGVAEGSQTGAEPGVDGRVPPGTNELVGDETAFTGMYALRRVDLFNILCIPDATRYPAPDELDAESVFSKALTLCEQRRAFLLVDPPETVDDVEAALDWKMNLALRSKNAAAYFPRLRMPDPLDGNKLRSFAPCGVIAGLYARTDTERGVWKAPAGTEANLRDVRDLAYELNDQENGVLNPLAVNCLRKFPIYSYVSWGARTLVGTDAEGSEWKYVPVRRTALMLEESIFRALHWVVFEPNDESLWAQIRLNVGAYMHGLFRQGAFQGKSARDAYYVKCDGETTTQADIDRGVVFVEVGFAPLKPAEFVVIRIKQMPGQLIA